MAEFRLETDRLLLRPWREADIEPFWAICQDVEVMRFIGPPQDRDAIAEAIAGQQRMQAQHGFCYWVTERKSDMRLIGFCGLLPGKPPLVDEIEIGWRLVRDAWGQGYAREAAEAALAWAWRSLDVRTIASMTVPANERSWGLMRRLGMSYVEGGDFDHPALPEGNPLRRHVLYRIARP